MSLSKQANAAAQTKRRRIQIDEVNVDTNTVTGKDMYGLPFQISYGPYFEAGVITVPKQGENWIIEQYRQEWRLKYKAQDLSSFDLSPGDKLIDANNLFISSPSFHIESPVISVDDLPTSDPEISNTLWIQNGFVVVSGAPLSPGGSVTQVASADTSIIVTDSTTTPILQLATLDVIATNEPPQDDWSNNNNKIRSIQDPTLAQDAATKNYVDTHTPPTTRTLNILMINNGSVLTTGIVGDVEIDFPCTIISWSLYADVSGSLVVDIWKAPYASFPPTSGNSITASAKPTLSSQINNQSSTLTGWTTSISSGDVLRFNINSVSTITRTTLSLKLQT